MIKNFKEACEAILTGKKARGILKKGNGYCCLGKLAKKQAQMEKRKVEWEMRDLPVPVYEFCGVGEITTTVNTLPYVNRYFEGSNPGLLDCNDKFMAIGLLNDGTSMSEYFQGRKIPKRGFTHKVIVDILRELYNNDGTKRKNPLKPFTTPEPW